MPKKQKAEIDPVKAAESTAAPAPAKKPATPRAKSAAATHKAAAGRTTRGAAKKTAEPETKRGSVEVTEVTAAAPVIAAGIEVLETPASAAAAMMVEEVTAAAVPEGHEPGTPEEREEIARLAYSYFVARDFAPGDPLADWLRAEEEYRSRRLARA